MIQNASHEINRFRAAHGDEPEVQSLLTTAQNLVDAARRSNDANDFDAADRCLEQAEVLILDAKHVTARLEELQQRICEILQGRP